MGDKCVDGGHQTNGGKQHVVRNAVGGYGCRVYIFGRISYIYVFSCECSLSRVRSHRKEG